MLVRGEGELGSTMHEYFSYKKDCLDHGFVRFIDAMGGDSSIVQAARVSYGQGTKTPSSDEMLVRYLMRNRHTSPFEMCQVKVHVKLPLFVARQWMRHRTGAFNEISARYSEMKDEFYTPEAKDISGQSNTNKQGAGGFLDLRDQQMASWLLRVATEEDYETYVNILNHGVAREQARCVLPVSLYTEFYWTVNLHNLLHFINLRADSHAQYEIRVYADALLELCKQLFPIATEAFQDYVQNATTFSAKEMEVLKSLLETFANETPGAGGIMAWAEKEMSKREFAEFKEKISR